MSHDYTRDDNFNDDPDNFEIGGDVVASEKAADQIERENSFSDVPPGEHTLIVSGFPAAPEEKPYTVTVNGRRELFTAHSVRVRLSLAGNPNCSISDFFLLPPSDPRQLNAYYNGVPDGKKQAGWAASKFIHFINRLGYPFPPGAKLPDEARRLGNWKGRAIIATVEAGRGTYTDANGVEKPRGNQIKPFSYRTTGQGGAGGNGGGAQPAHLQAAAARANGGTAGSPPARPTSAPVMAAAVGSAGSSAGLDNL